MPSRFPTNLFSFAARRDHLGAIARDLARETKALKAVHRACLILRYVHGMNRTEIAERLGLSENQVKGYLQYALTILRREMEKTHP